MSYWNALMVSGSCPLSASRPPCGIEKGLCENSIFFSVSSYSYIGKSTIQARSRRGCAKTRSSSRSRHIRTSGSRRSRRDREGVVRKLDLLLGLVIFVHREVDDPGEIEKGLCENSIFFSVSSYSYIGKSTIQARSRRGCAKTRSSSRSRHIRTSGS